MIPEIYKFINCCLIFQILDLIVYVITQITNYKGLETLSDLSLETRHCP